MGKRRQKQKTGEIQTHNTSQILLYQSQDGKTQVEVNLHEETIWLSQKQMAELFDKDTDTIGLHLRNIFKEGELEERATTEESSVVQQEGQRQVRRNIRIYNLDAIISVGYRVNSKRGTQFRIWATQVLHQHLVEGYTLNQKHLQAQAEKLRELQQAIRMIDQIAEHKALAADESSALIHVIRDYAYGLDLIDAYDHQRVGIAKVSKKAGRPIAYQAARKAIDDLRAFYQAGDLFGREKDESLQGSLANIFQTFDGKALYPSIEEKAANLLYFLVRNHPFIDGNKRIAAFMFLWFLEKNKSLYRADRSKRIADNALVALTLMVAESKAQEKDIIVNMTVNLINSKNE